MPGICFVCCFGQAPIIVDITASTWRHQCNWQVTAEWSTHRKMVPLVRNPCKHNTRRGRLFGSIQILTDLTQRYFHFFKHNIMYITVVHVCTAINHMMNSLITHWHSTRSMKSSIDWKEPSFLSRTAQGNGSSTKVCVSAWIFYSNKRTMSTRQNALGRG